MQFLPTPVWVVVIAEVTWLMSHGAAGVSYAFFNTTMRREFVKIFCSSIKTAPTTVTAHTGRTTAVQSDQLSDFEF